MGHSQGYNRRARKIIHLLGGLPALLIPFFPWQIILGGSVLGLLLAFFIKPSHGPWLKAITKPSDRQLNVISGVRSYFATVLVLVLVWLALIKFVSPDAQLELLAYQIVMFGWLALALGDGLAGLIGPAPQHTRTVPWSPHKTLWGMLGCFIGTVIAYFAVQFVLGHHFSQFFGNHIAYMDYGWDRLTHAVTAGICVALAESLEVGVDDNYLVGFSSAMMMVLFQVGR